MYILQLMDTYAPSYALLVVGLLETIVISWVYGKKILLNVFESHTLLAVNLHIYQ